MDRLPRETTKSWHFGWSVTGASTVSGGVGRLVNWADNSLRLLIANSLSPLGNAGKKNLQYLR